MIPLLEMAVLTLIALLVLSCSVSERRQQHAVKIADSLLHHASCSVTLQQSNRSNHAPVTTVVNSSHDTSVGNDSI